MIAFPSIESIISFWCLKSFLICSLILFTIVVYVAYFFPLLDVYGLNFLTSSWFLVLGRPRPPRPRPPFPLPPCPLPRPILRVNFRNYVTVVSITMTHEVLLAITHANFVYKLFYFLQRLSERAPASVNLPQQIRTLPSSSFSLCGSQLLIATLN